MSYFLTKIEWAHSTGYVPQAFHLLTKNEASRWWILELAHSQKGHLPRAWFSWRRWSNRKDKLAKPQHPYHCSNSRSHFIWINWPRSKSQLVVRDATTQKVLHEPKTAVQHHDGDDHDDDDDDEHFSFMGCLLWSVSWCGTFPRHGFYWSHSTKETRATSARWDRWLLLTVIHGPKNGYRADPRLPNHHKYLGMIPGVAEPTTWIIYPLLRQGPPLDPSWEGGMRMCILGKRGVPNCRANWATVMPPPVPTRKRTTRLTVRRPPNLCFIGECSCTCIIWVIRLIIQPFWFRYEIPSNVSYRGFSMNTHDRIGFKHTWLWGWYSLVHDNCTSGHGITMHHCHRNSTIIIPLMDVLHHWKNLQAI